MNASTFTARVIVSTLSDLGLGSRRRRRRAQGPAARRRAEPRLAHDRRDRHGRERRAVAAREARRGRAADGLRPPRLPHVRPARACARRRSPRRSRARTSGWRSRATSRRRRCACCDEYKPGRQLYTNVEYYAAVVLGGVDLPPDLYPATFAAARTAGWTAHILEQLAAQPADPPDGRLRRADARVLSPRPGAGRRLCERLRELLDARLGGLEPACGRSR